MQLNKDRIGVLIGQDGVTKKLIENRTGTILKIDSEKGICNILVDEDIEEKEIEKKEIPPIGMRKYITKFVVKAINHGFNPNKAIKLTQEDMILEIVDLEKVLGHSRKKLKRMKGRVIGKNGKIRSSLEYFSGCYISVYKKYIAIIGDYERIKIAKKALNMILQGAPHKPVLNYLQEQYERLKQQEFSKMWKPVL